MALQEARSAKTFPFGQLERFVFQLVSLDLSSYTEHLGSREH